MVAMTKVRRRGKPHRYNDPDLLAPRQRQILTYIVRMLKEQGRVPAVEELRADLHFRTLPSVYAALMRLEDKGFIKVGERRHRSIEVPGIRVTAAAVPGPELARLERALVAE